ncbi:hypothetical protein [Nonomuraea sp. B19D2]|uniref:hypothetical protein n=1 Tax=Nonomuraea sp. B19D2 TaxID=3159561 RepID=UPI0032DB1FF9
MLWPALTSPGKAAERLRAMLEAMFRAADQHLELLAGMYVPTGRCSTSLVPTPWS